MRETKLKRLILGIGIGTLVLTAALILVWKLRFYDVVNQSIRTETTAYTTASQTAAGLQKALDDEALATQKLKLATAQLEYFRQRFRSLQFDLKSPGAINATYVRYLNESFLGYGLAIRRQLVTAADQTGVTIDTKIAVNAPPQNPEDVVSPPSGFIKPLQSGAIEVTAVGTLPDILRFMERVNRAEILMAVGNVKLEGTSPTIKATFTLTPYLLASGPSALINGPAVAAPAAGTTGPQVTPSTQPAAAG